MKRFPSAALLLLVAAAAAAVAAPLTDAQLDEIEHGILPLRHGYDRNDALAAFARQEGAPPDGRDLLRTSLSNALATAVATNPAPFEIPVPRSPPAPRVLPDTFVLPEIPQEWRE